MTSVEPAGEPRDLNKLSRAELEDLIHQQDEAITVLNETQQGLIDGWKSSLESIKLLALTGLSLSLNTVILMHLHGRDSGTPTIHETFAIGLPATAIARWIAHSTQDLNHMRFAEFEEDDPVNERPRRGWVAFHPFEVPDEIHTPIDLSLSGSLFMEIAEAEERGMHEFIERTGRYKVVSIDGSYHLRYDAQIPAISLTIIPVSTTDTVVTFRCDHGNPAIHDYFQKLVQAGRQLGSGTSPRSTRTNTTHQRRRGENDHYTEAYNRMREGYSFDEARDWWLEQPHPESRKPNREHYADAKDSFRKAIAFRKRAEGRKFDEIS